MRSAVPTAAPQGTRLASEHKAAAMPANGTTRLAPIELPPELSELGDTGEVPEWLLCPITMEVMGDPVVATDGHTYERDAITKWLKNNARSPVTNQGLPGKALITNHAMRSQVMAIMEAKGYVREFDRGA